MLSPPRGCPRLSLSPPPSPWSRAAVCFARLCLPRCCVPPPPSHPSPPLDRLSAGALRRHRPPLVQLHRSRESHAVSRELSHRPARPRHRMLDSKGAPQADLGPISPDLARSRVTSRLPHRKGLPHGGARRPRMPQHRGRAQAARRRHLPARRQPVAARAPPPQPDASRTRPPPCVPRRSLLVHNLKTPSGFAYAWEHLQQADLPYDHEARC